VRGRIRALNRPAWLQPRRRELALRTPERLLSFFSAVGATADKLVWLPLNTLAWTKTTVVIDASMSPISYSLRDPAANASDAHDGKQRSYDILHGALDFSSTQATIC
jgi:hypothetical protein